MDSSFDQGRGRERGLRQHPVQRHLGKFYQLSPDFNLNQIGSTWVVTAAHCLYKDGELVDAKSLSILLGLHNRSKKSEPKRCHSRSDQHHERIHITRRPCFLSFAEPMPLLKPPCFLPQEANQGGRNVCPRELHSSLQQQSK